MNHHVYMMTIVAYTGAVHFDSASENLVLVLQVLDLIDCSTYYLFIEQHLSSQLLLSSSV